MSKKNRARSRAVRAKMARTGENYTRVANALSGEAGSASADMTDLVRHHVRRVLESNRQDDDARARFIEDLEARGRRIVDGGQIQSDSWDIRDWRTGALIARGDLGLDEEDAVAERLDPDGAWFHIDRISEYVELPPYVETEGLPFTLGRAVEEWVRALDTPDEEIAELVGWTVEKIREYL